MRHRQEISLMTIPYRVRRGLQRFFITLCVLVLLAVLVLGLWLLSIFMILLLITLHLIDFYVINKHAKRTDCFWIVIIRSVLCFATEYGFF